MARWKTETYYKRTRYDILCGRPGTLCEKEICYGKRGPTWFPPGCTVEDETRRLMAGYDLSQEEAEVRARKNFEA
jgi:hypothetical protein